MYAGRIVGACFSVAGFAAYLLAAGAVSGRMSTLSSPGPRPTRYPSAPIGYLSEGRIPPRTLDVMGRADPFSQRTVRAYVAGLGRV